MSKLYYRDIGFVIPDLCEEVNFNRRIVKFLNLSQTSSPGKLFLLARPHSLDSSLLYVSINESIPFEIPVFGSVPAFFWYSLDIPADLLIEGKNRIEIWSNGDAMDAWTIAMDNQANADSDSFLSIDQGNNWTANHKGRLAVSRGEYLVRIRLEEGVDEMPVNWVDGDFLHPRLSAMHRLIPSDVNSAASTLNKARLLSSWVSQSFEYMCASPKSTLYTPWDAATILSWGKSQKGQNGERPMVFCVHYAVVFITACQALGIHARGAVFTEQINSFNGHFAAEVWIPEFKKWVFVDPNIDAIFIMDGKPLSVTELRSLPDLEPFAHFGPGYAYQMQNPAIEEFMKIYLNGRFMKLRGIWPRADFLSHPELTPPGHGSLAYCEPDIIWEESSNLAMFPSLVEPAYFDCPLTIN